jgi:hypothetical protein
LISLEVETNLVPRVRVRSRRPFISIAHERYLLAVAKESPISLKSEIDIDLVSDTPLGAPCDRDWFLHRVHRGQMLLRSHRSDNQHISARQQTEFFSTGGLGVASNKVEWQNRADCDHASANPDCAS